MARPELFMENPTKMNKSSKYWDPKFWETHPCRYVREIMYYHWRSKSMVEFLLHYQWYVERDINVEGQRATEQIRGIFYSIFHEFMGWHYAIIPHSILDTLANHQPSKETGESPRS